MNLHCMRHPLGKETLSECEQKAKYEDKERLQEVRKLSGYLIKDTTREERQRIVEESLGNISANCDGCMAGLAEMYQDYIEGRKEIREINMEFHARYTRGDMDKEEKRHCGYM